MWGTLSPEATKAKQEAAIRYRAKLAQVEKMERGPYYADGCLRTPSSVWNPKAIAEWQTRRMTWDAAKQEWYRAIPVQYAQEQVRKARAVFFQIWGIANQ